MDFWATTVLTAIALGSVIFIIAVGLSLVMGLMGVLNLAHGALVMVGAYIGVYLQSLGAGYWLAAVGGAVAAGVVGLILERGWLRHLYQRFDEQVLVTFGLVYVSVNVVVWVWSARVPPPMLPGYLTGSFAVGDYAFPIQRVGLMIVGFGAFIALWLCETRTKVGAVVRAGLENREMVSALGLNYPLIAMATFAIGAMMAGMGGFLAAPLMGVWHTLAFDALLLALVVVIVGGMGSIVGAFIGAMVVAVTQTLVAVYAQDLAVFSIWAVLVLMLVLRPQGILGKAS